MYQLCELAKKRFQVPTTLFLFFTAFFQTELVQDEAPILLHIFDCDAEPSLLVYWVNRVELIACTGVDRAEFSKWSHMDAAGSQGNQRSGTMTTIGNQHFESRVELANNAYDRPDRVGITSSRIQAEVDTLVGFRLLENPEQSLLHIGA